MAAVRGRTYRVVRENTQGLEMHYVTSHRGQTAERDDKNINFLQRFSLLLINLLSCSHRAFAFVGSVVECTLNFLAENKCFWTGLCRCIFHRDELVFPKEGGSNYHTLIWQLDPRTKLYTDTSASAKAHSTNTDTDCFPVGSRRTLDVAIMASKLVYENENVVEEVVKNVWKMNFEGFYLCWNEYYQSFSTVALIFADKPMNAIFLAWRGTEPFNTWDWSTDIDFSFAKFNNGMAVHVGFLEALGLCHRGDVDSFTKMDNNAEKKRDKRVLKQTEEEINNTQATSGLSDDIKNSSKRLAYDDITKKVAKLLYDHRHARLFVTGHSLGGALAAVYGAMLHYNAETEITGKLAAIYTFGQPRVGNKEFADYANDKLKDHYNRVVYCNDIIPRVPFDDKLFEFKHFGECHYYDNCYNGWGLNLQDLYCDGWWLSDGADLNTIEAFYYLILCEQPEINILGAQITAVVELIQCAVILPCRHGCEYMESVVLFLARLAGIFVPGVAVVVAHSPRNYVNAVRLGPCRLYRGTPRTPNSLCQFLGSVYFYVLALVVCFLGSLYAMF